MMYSINYYDERGLIDRSFDAVGNEFDTIAKTREYAQKHTADLSAEFRREVRYVIKHEPNWQPFSSCIIKA